MKFTNKANETVREFVEAYDEFDQPLIMEEDLAILNQILTLFGNRESHNGDLPHVSYSIEELKFVRKNSAKYTTAVSDLTQLLTNMYPNVDIDVEFEFVPPTLTLVITINARAYTLGATEDGDLRPVLMSNNKDFVS